MACWGTGVSAAASGPNLDFWLVPWAGFRPCGVSTSMGLGAGDLMGSNPLGGGVFFLKGLISALHEQQRQVWGGLQRCKISCRSVNMSCAFS